MNKNKINWTEQQKAAIEQRGKNLYVTASAGTGKTAVLAARCADIIADKNLCPDVNRLLVLTFTEAAALQMKQRIGKYLKRKLQQQDSRHLRRQLTLLQTADISTIHAFCKKIITRYFYKLSLDPTFSIVDEDEQKLLKNQALQKTIEWAWLQPELKEPLIRLFENRNLSSTNDFCKNIIKISQFLDSLAQKHHWFERSKLIADAVNPFKTETADQQIKFILKKLKYFRDQLQYCCQLYQQQLPDGSWSQKIQQDFLTPIEQSIEYLENNRWDDFAELINNFQKPSRIEYKPKNIDEDTAEIIQKISKNQIEQFLKLPSLALLNPRYLEAISPSVTIQTRVLIRLVEKFESLYSDAKLALNLLDFADLEHYALQLLTEPDTDSPTPSETALELREKYLHVFVDEYQDINPLQKKIIDTVKSKDNLFVVGDVKQSIYAFRGSEPKIFVDDLHKICKTGDADSLRIDLNKNFRSNKTVLDFVNSVFEKIMTTETAGIEYDNRAKLIPGTDSQLQQDTTPNVELHILDEPDKDFETDYSKLQLQAALIAKKITQIVGSKNQPAMFEIFDTNLKKYRPPKYSDIAILFRSPSVRVNDYVNILRLAGIPANSQQAAGFFDASEIKDCLSLLKVLDNLLQDIDLAAILRSPLFSITDDQLALIRLAENNDSTPCPLYHSMLKYSQEGANDQLKEKINAIITQLQTWQKTARQGQIDQMLWDVFNQTYILAFISTLPNGPTRKANLLKMHQWAIQFQNFASSKPTPSLTKFVEFLQDIQEQNARWATAEPKNNRQDAVQITSIHKSKGLEYNIVFLAELNTNFNNTDTTSEIILNDENTIGIKIIQPETNTSYESLAHQVIAQKKSEKLIAEELRILYVACTRAKQKLFIVGRQKQKDAQMLLKEAILQKQNKTSLKKLAQYKNHLQWILYALADSRNLHETFQTNLENNCTNNDNLFCSTLYNDTMLTDLGNYLSSLKNVSPGSSINKLPAVPKIQQIENVISSLDYKYNFSDSTTTPAKLSVTGLTHKFNLSDNSPDANFFTNLNQKPKSLTQQTPAGDSLAIGNATHLLISKLDLNAALTQQSIEKTIADLVSKNALNSSIVETIDIESVIFFFNSQLGQKILASKKIYREWPFTFAYQPEIPENSPDDFIIVQGIIDLLAVINDSLVIIDFKTDNVTAKTLPQRANNYRMQLDIYADAAKKILKINNAEKWLYFIKSRQSYRIE